LHGSRVQRKVFRTENTCTPPMAHTRSGSIQRFLVLETFCWTLEPCYRPKHYRRYCTLVSSCNAPSNSTQITNLRQDRTSAAYPNRGSLQLEKTNEVNETEHRSRVICIRPNIGRLLVSIRCKRKIVFRILGTSNPIKLARRPLIASVPNFGACLKENFESR
jgi:hypothetical protein